jgi:serine/threonine-protein kinase
MSPQQSIAHYRIVSKLGEGGMGAVYRATDTKLGRDVAIKILPDAFAANPDRMARFQREAQVLASLNHPNIAAIYGVEERALVMELVEGTKLSGPQSLNEALPLIHQFVDALEYAHEKGIIHRDLKPANIMVTSAGRLKLLDFGLAKALSAESSWNAETTLTIQQTCAGAIVGTPAYMSPEQLRGKPVDKRTDIWALGAIVYELLTGSRVADENPDWTALPKNVTPGLQRLLQLCLEPDLRKRLRDIGDAGVILDGIPNQPPPKKRQWLHWGIDTALLVGVVAAIGFCPSRPNDAAGVRFTIPYPEEPPSADRDRFPNQVQAAPAPDGRTIAFVASGKPGATQLWIRKLNSF